MFLGRHGLPAAALIALAAPALAAPQTPRPAPGSACVLAADLPLSADIGKPPGPPLTRGAAVVVVSIAKGWAKVSAGDRTGAVRLPALRTTCKPPPAAGHAPGTICTLQAAARLTPDARGKGKKVVAERGSRLTLTGTDATAYAVTFGGRALFGARAALDKGCTWDASVTGGAGDAAPSPVALAATSPAMGPSDTPVIPPLPPLPTPPDAAPEATPAPSAAPPLQPLVPQPAAPSPEPVLSHPRTVIPDSRGYAKVAVMDLRRPESFDKDLAESLNALIPQTLEDTRAFKAISSQDIKQMLMLESLKQQVGCDTTSCLAEVGGALGVDYMVTGSILLADQTYLVQLQLMNIGSSRVDGRATREYRGGPGGLVDEIRVAVKLLVRDVLASRAGKLSVVASEEGATVRLDGAIVGTSPMPAYAVPAGMHTLSVEKEGFVRFTEDVDVLTGREIAVRADLRPSQEYLLKRRASARTTRGLAWTSLAVAALGFGAGGVLYGMTAQSSQQLTKDIDAYNASPTSSQAAYDALQERKKTIATRDALAVAAGGVGLAALVTGVVLFVTGDDPARYDDATTSVGVAAAPPSVTILASPRALALRIDL